MGEARQAGRIHAGHIETCDRLKAVHTLLADGAEHSTAEIAEAGRTYAVSPLVSELRFRGAWIDCRYAGKTAAGRRLYLYRMIARCPQTEAT